MSQVFEGYERQYCELSANLARKCTSAGLLDGGKGEPNLVAVMNAQFFVLCWNKYFDNLLNHSLLSWRFIVFRVIIL